MTNELREAVAALERIVRRQELSAHVSANGRNSDQRKVDELYAMGQPHEIAADALAALTATTPEAAAQAEGREQDRDAAIRIWQKRCAPFAWRLGDTPPSPAVDAMLEFAALSPQPVQAQGDEHVGREYTLSLFDAYAEATSEGHWGERATSAARLIIEALSGDLSEHGAAPAVDRGLFEPIDGRRTTPADKHPFSRSSDRPDAAEHPTSALVANRAEQTEPRCSSGADDTATPAEPVAPGGVPSGWALVPSKATDEMVLNVYLGASVTGLDDFAIREIWDAMLEAATPALAASAPSQAEPTAAEADDGGWRAGMVSSEGYEPPRAPSQAEPKPCRSFECRAAKADGVLCANEECDIAAGHRQAPSQAESDVGAMEYRGNTVSYIYAKKDAYAQALDSAWQVLREFGHNSDGSTPLNDMIRKALVASSQAGSCQASEPTDEQIIDAIESEFSSSKGGWPESDAEIVRAFLRHYKPSAPPAGRTLTAEAREALEAALPYVVAAYECAFPDEDRNQEVEQMIRAILAASSTTAGERE